MKMSDLIIEKNPDLGAIDRYVINVVRGLEEGMVDATPNLLAAMLPKKDEVANRLRDVSGSEWAELAAWIEQIPLDYYQKLIAGVHCALLHLSPVDVNDFQH